MKEYQWDAERLTPLLCLPEEFRRTGRFTDRYGLRWVRREWGNTLGAKCGVWQRDNGVEADPKALQKAVTQALVVGHFDFTDADTEDTPCDSD